MRYIPVTLLSFYHADLIFTSIFKCTCLLSWSVVIGNCVHCRVKTHRYTRARTHIIEIFLSQENCNKTCHVDIIKWKHFPRYWFFVRGIHRLPMYSPQKKIVTQKFDVFIDLRLNIRISKHSKRRWFKTPSCPLRCQCNSICSQCWVYRFLITTSADAGISEVNCLIYMALELSHKERNSVSDHQSHDCLFNRLFKAQIKENIKASRHLPLWGEFTGHRWIPCTKGQ